MPTMLSAVIRVYGPVYVGESIPRDRAGAAGQHGHTAERQKQLSLDAIRRLAVALATCGRRLRGRRLDEGGSGRLLIGCVHDGASSTGAGRRRSAKRRHAAAPADHLSAPGGQSA